MSSYNYKEGLKMGGKGVKGDEYRDERRDLAGEQF